MIKVSYQREYLDHHRDDGEEWPLSEDRVVTLPSPQAARAFIRKINPVRVRRDEHGNRVRDSGAQLIH